MKVTEEMISRLKNAVEGECEGLAIDDTQARNILDYALSHESGEAERRVLADPCVKKLADDEPFFVLLGRDQDASHALSTWISYRLRREGASSKTQAAEATLDAFRDYQDRSALKSAEGK